LEHLETLLDEVLTDDLQDLVLLEHFTRNVKREIFGINNTLDETEPFGHQVLTVIHDEDTTNVELDVVSLLLGLEHIERSTLGNVKDSTEFELTFNREMLDSQMVFPIVRESLVEFRVFFSLDILRVTGPERLGLVEFLVLNNGFLDGLLLLLILLLFLISNFFNLGTFSGDNFLLIVRDFLLNLLLNNELNRVRDELGVLLNNVLDLLLIKVFELE
jgi:hypothetical protein